MRASLFCVAILGLCLSVAVHVATFCGIDPQQVFPAVWMLHVGIFAIWFPAILFTNRRIGSLPRREQGAARIRGTPRMMRAVLRPLFAYTAFNFFFTIFVLQGGHSPTIRDSTFALQDSGRIVRALTEREYHRYRAYEVRPLDFILLCRNGDAVSPNGRSRERGLWSDSVHMIQWLVQCSFREGK